MQNNTQPSWEEEFDEKYIKLVIEKYPEFVESHRILLTDIKQFISFLLTKQAEEISEAVEGIKKNYHCGACDGGKFEHTLGCKALKDILDLPAIKQITIK